MVLICVTSSLSALTYDMEKHCSVEIAAKVVRVSSNLNGTEFLCEILKLISHWLVCCASPKAACSYFKFSVCDCLSFHSSMTSKQRL